MPKSFNALLNPGSPCSYELTAPKRKKIHFGASQFGTLVAINHFVSGWIRELNLRKFEETNVAFISGMVSLKIFL